MNETKLPDDPQSPKYVELFIDRSRFAISRSINYAFAPEVLAAVVRALESNPSVQSEDALQHPLPCCGECGEFQWRQWCQNCGNNHPMPTVQAKCRVTDEQVDRSLRLRHPGTTEFSEVAKRIERQYLEAALGGHDDLPTEAQTKATRGAGIEPD